MRPDKSSFRSTRGVPLRQPSMQTFDHSAVYFEASSKILNRACSKGTASAEGEASYDPFMAA
jgi:hypothetical protein